MYDCKIIGEKVSDQNDARYEETFNKNKIPDVLGENIL